MSREKINFDEGWMFHKGDFEKVIPKRTAIVGTCGGPSNTTIEEGIKLVTPTPLKTMLGDDNIAYRICKIHSTLQGNWQNVNLPHDCSLLPPDERPEEKTVDLAVGIGDDGYRPGNIGWYRKTFQLPDADLGKRIFIDFDGVMRDSTFWINGSYLGMHSSGYTSFSFDITDYLRYGQEGSNVILVRIDTGTSEGWWDDGGGIYRHVWLVKMHPLHIARHGVGISTDEITEQQALCRIETTCINDGSKDISFTLVQTIIDPYGKEVATSSWPGKVGFCASLMETLELPIPNPQLWDLESPSLYTLITSLENEDGQVDQTKTTFGIRSIIYTREGLLLNGKRREIKGVCAHQDFAGVGIALPDQVIKHKITLLKDMGCNAYRSAHHPPNPELLDICDQLGILVLNENRHLETNPEGIADLTEMILRDRNHPSIFMWCLENEELIAAHAEGKRLLKRLVDIAHRLDPTRQVTIAGMMACEDYAYMGVPDVAGFNYDKGEGPALYARYSDLRILATEDASFTSTRGVYKHNLAAGMCSSYNHGSFYALLKSSSEQESEDEVEKGQGEISVNHLDYAWNHYREHPGLGGIFVWAGFDYRGKWPTVTSPYGAMDFCGFPKDAFYYWKSCWVDEPLVHILPHWNWKMGEEVTINLYTNCDEVELLLNSNSLGRFSTCKGQIFAKRIIYAPGEIKAIAFKKGLPVAECVRQTIGQAAQLKLVSDRTQLLADGQDVAIIRVEVIDVEGRVIPDAENQIEVSVEGVGNLLGVGNGNPADHTSDKSSIRNTFNGLMLVLIQSSQDSGIIVVKISTSGLIPAEIVLRSSLPYHWAASTQ